MYRKFNYKQIIPCTVPTNALFSGLTDDEDGGCKMPVVCWALVEEIEDGESYIHVIGMVYGDGSALDLVEKISNFAGYEEA